MFKVFKNLFEEAEFNKRRQEKQARKKSSYSGQESSDWQQEKSSDSSRQQSGESESDTNHKQKQRRSNQNYKENKSQESQQNKGQNERKSYTYSRSMELTQALEFFSFNDLPSKIELKKRYKQLCIKFHPDKAKGNADKMKLLNQYKEIIEKYL